MSKRDIILKTGLSLFSIVFMFILLEMGARIYKHEWRWKNFWLLERDFVSSAYPVQFDQELGWIPEAGIKGMDNIWGTDVTILSDTTRSNGGNAERKTESKPLIIAVGDSFVFGDEVSDNETWPAYLEGMLGARVINGGVCGYGIDQSFIRARKLVSEYNPDILVFGFTPDDIRRSGLSVYLRVPKPYFSIVAERLMLHNEHLAAENIKSNDDVLRRVLGYSFFIHKFMRKVFPQYWLQGCWESIGSEENGETVSSLLMRDLVSLYRESPKLKKIYVLVQYLANPSLADYTSVNNVLMHINGSNIEIVDMRYKLNEIRKTDFEKFRSLYYKHMTANGNKLVAEVVAESINKRKDTDE